MGKRFPHAGPRGGLRHPGALKCQSLLRVNSEASSAASAESARPHRLHSKDSIRKSHFDGWGQSAWAHRKSGTAQVDRC